MSPVREAPARDPIRDGWLRWAPVWGLGLYAAVALGFWVEPHWRPEWDSALYLLTARSIEAGEGYRYLGEPFFLRPPGLSWLLSWLPAPRPGPTGFDEGLLNGLWMGFAIAALVGIHGALRRSMGPARALGVALATGLSPLFVAQLNWILSDLPFLVLLFPALALLDRGTRGGEGSTRAALAGTLLLAAAAYLRTAALVALPGVVLVAAARRQGAARLWGLAPLLGVTAALLPWLVHVRSVAARAPRPAEQLMLYDYTTALLHRDPGDPASPRLGLAEWGERIVTHGEALAADLARGTFGSGEPWAIALLVAAIAAGGLAARRRGPDTLDGFALAYAGLLVVYFTSHSRLVLPLVPFVYRAVVEGLDLTTARLAGPIARWPLVPVALALAALLAVGVSALPRQLDAASKRLPWGQQGAVWRDIEAAAAWLAQESQPSERALAGPAPSLSLLSGREVHTYRFARRPGLIERGGLRWGVLFPWTPARIAAPLRARALARREIESRAQPGASIELLDFGPPARR